MSISFVLGPNSVRPRNHARETYAIKALRRERFAEADIYHPVTGIAEHPAPVSDQQGSDMRGD